MSLGKYLEKKGYPKPKVETKPYGMISLFVPRGESTLEQFQATSQGVLNILNKRGFVATINGSDCYGTPRIKDATKLFDKNDGNDEFDGVTISLMVLTDEEIIAKFNAHVKRRN